MGRRNLRGGFGENRPSSIRFSEEDRRLLRIIEERWQLPRSEALRRAIREAEKATRTQQE